MSSDLEQSQAQLAEAKQKLAFLEEDDADNRAQLTELIAGLEELIALQASFADPSASSSSSFKPGESSSSSSRKAFASDGYGTSVWKAGDECMAKTSNRGWQRARIANVGGSAVNSVYSVLFKDNGQTELLKAGDLKPLPASAQNGYGGGNGSSYANSGEGNGASGKKRKFANKEEEEEAERRKKRNAKKVEAREVKAQEQKAKQDSWKKFTTKAAKKGIDVAGVTGRSIFKTPDNPYGKVGVTGSGKGMTENATRPKNKFSKDEDGGV